MITHIHATSRWSPHVYALKVTAETFLVKNWKHAATAYCSAMLLWFNYCIHHLIFRFVMHRCGEIEVSIAEVSLIFLLLFLSQTINLGYTSLWRFQQSLTLMGIKKFCVVAREPRFIGKNTCVHYLMYLFISHHGKG
jgi:hypothetical protein